MTDRPGRRTPVVSPGRSPKAAGLPPADTSGGGGRAFTSVRDRFYRQLVLGMRNGVLAVTRDGRLAVVNEAACRILEIAPRRDHLGRDYTEVLASQPEIVRILSTAFDLAHLPNRAELRLKPSGKVIGYTLSHIPGEDGRPEGAAVFFKDLTLVEQMEERDRLRDRLAALGEMAAAIAHEVKNPLAGIEVMAGLLRRRVADDADAQSLVNDIINEAKVANAIVIEVLEFVRPIRLQVEQTSIAQVLHDAVSIAERKVNRGGVNLTLDIQEQLPLLRADHHQLCQLFGNLLINGLEALGGTRHDRHHGAPRVSSTRSRPERRRTRRRRHARHRHRGRRPGPDAGDCRAGVQPVLHHQAAGVGPRPGHRAEDRGRARWAHRPEDGARSGHAVPRDPAAQLGRAVAAVAGDGLAWDEY